MKQKNNNSKSTAPKRNFWQIVEQVLHSKWVLGAMVVAIAVVFNENYSSIFDKKVDLGGDSIYYYSLGQALAHGEGYSNTISLEKKPHSHFPPGYPYFISKIIKVFPEKIETVKKANGALYCLSLILLFFVVFVATNNSVVAFCTSLLGALHMELLRYATVMMSEPLYIFLSLLSILMSLLIVKSKIGNRWRWLVWLAMVVYGLIIAYMYLVRTMSLALVISLTAWTGILAVANLIRWIKAMRKHDDSKVCHRWQFVKCTLLCVITIVAVGASKLSWDARNRNLGIVNEDYKNTFFKKTNNEDMQGVADWKVRIKSNTSQFIARWIPEATCMKPQVCSAQDVDKFPILPKEWFWGILLLLVMIAGALYMNCGRLLMLFYVGLTVGILILYPEQFGGIRYIVPVIPLFIFLLLNGLSAIVAAVYRLFKLKHSSLLLQSIVVVIFTFAYLRPKYVEAQTPYKQAALLKSWFLTADPHARDFLRAAQYCGDSLPEDARIINRKPEVFYMFSNYHRSNGFPRYADPDTIYNMLCRDSIEYLIIDDWYRHARVTLGPCVDKYSDKFMVIKQFGETDTIQKTNPTYVLRFNDYWGYTGDLVNGLREGEGVLHLQNGFSYEGHFSNNLPNGLGTYFNSEGEVVAKGIWEDGILKYMYIER